MTGKKLLGLYSTHQSLHWFAIGLLVPVMALLQLEKGLDLFQIGLTVAVYSTTVMALELPTGGLADSKLLFTLLAIQDPHVPETDTDGDSGFQKLPHILGASITYGVKNRVVLMLLASTAALGFAVFYIVIFLFNGISTSPHAAIMNREIPSTKRSTLLSFESLILESGVVVGSIFMGFVSKKHSISVAWGIGSAILLISSVFYLFIPKTGNPGAGEVM
jgi:MFS family permease